MIYTVLCLMNPEMSIKNVLYSILAILFGLPLVFFLFPSFGVWFVSIFVTLAEWMSLSLPSFNDIPSNILSQDFRSDKAFEVSFIASVILWSEELFIGISAGIISLIFSDKSEEVSAHDMFDKAE